MKIYKLRFDVDNYDNIIPCNKFSVDKYRMFDGKSLVSTWEKMQVKRMEPDKHLSLGDAPGFVIPVFSRKAAELLLPLIKNDVEILPMECEGIDLFGINVLSVIDAVDYNKSVYKTFRDGKRIMAFKKYSFIPERIRNKNIFKIEDERRRNAFVSESFYKLVKENGLEGFKMEQVWEGD